MDCYQSVKGFITRVKNLNIRVQNSEMEYKLNLYLDKEDNTRNRQIIELLRELW